MFQILLNIAKEINDTGNCNFKTCINISNLLIKWSTTFAILSWHTLLFYHFSIHNTKCYAHISIGHCQVSVLPFHQLQ